jgi:hypothetical protein
VLQYVKLAPEPADTAATTSVASTSTSPTAELQYVTLTPEMPATLAARTVSRGSGVSRAGSVVGSRAVPKSRLGTSSAIVGVAFDEDTLSHIEVDDATSGPAVAITQTISAAQYKAFFDQKANNEVSEFGMFWCDCVVK